MRKIIDTINQYLKAEDKILLTLLLATIPLTVSYYVANALGAQFAGVDIITPRFLLLMPLMVGLYIASIYACKITPRIGFVTWTYTMFYLIVMFNGMLTNYIQLTPYHTIDFSLVKIDKFLGFNQLAWLNWTYAHPWIQKIVNQCYGLMGFQLAIVPMVLALLMQKRAVRVLFISLLISFIIGTGIYYFFPTTAPASMFHDPNFALQQHDTFIKFFEIHHFLPVTTTQGGLIAFPSFHVVWAVLLAYSFRHKKYLFYPMALFNIIIILSTLMLGWHYLTDVIGGIILAGLSIAVAEVVHQKYIAVERKKVEAIKPMPISRDPLVSGMLARNKLT